MGNNSSLIPNNNNNLNNGNHDGRNNVGEIGGADDDDEMKLLDSFIQLMNTQCTSLSEQLVFAAKNGTDRLSLRLFEQLLSLPDHMALNNDLNVTPLPRGGNDYDAGYFMGDDVLSSDDNATATASCCERTLIHQDSSTSLLSHHHHHLRHDHVHSPTTPSTLQSKRMESWLTDVRNSTSGTTMTSSNNTIVIKVENVKDKEYNNCTLMHLLAQRNKVDCMDYLFQYRSSINLNATDTFSSTPLLYACGHNCEEAVAWLLAQPSVNINAKDIYNKCALLLCLKNKNYAMAEMLLSRGGLDVHAKATKGNTVLHVMCQDGDLGGVKFLVERCNASIHRRNNDEENVLSFVVWHTHLSDYFSKKFSGNGLAKLLLSTNTMGRTVVHQVASSGFFENLLTMFKHLTMGELASSQVVSMLNGADKYGDTPLILAVKNSRTDMVHFLCQCIEVRINEGDAMKNTALHYAVNAKNRKMISLLTAFGATLKAENGSDESSDPMQRNRIVTCCMSLSTALMVIIAIVAILCIVSIAAIAFGFFDSNVSANALDIRKRGFREVIGTLRDSIHEFNTFGITSFTLMEKHVDMNDGIQVLDFCYDIYRANYRRMPLLFIVYSGLDNGCVAGITYEGNDKSYIFYSYPDQFRNYFIDIPHTSNTSLEEALTFPNRSNVVTQEAIDKFQFLKQARPLQETRWSKPYVSEFITGFMYLTLLFVKREPITNQFIGYLALDITTDTIDAFLKEKARESSSFIVIVERATGYLIGTSDPSVPIFKTVQGLVFDRFDGTTGKNRRLSTMMKFARSRYGGILMPKVGNSSKFDQFHLDGQLQALNIGGVKDEFGIDWIILETMPFSLFFERFYVSMGVLAGMTCLLLLVSVLVAIIAARLFMNPLLVLIDQANDIKVLQLEKVERSLQKNASRFTEMKQLQSSFSAMVQRLKQYRQFIPDHILVVLEAEFNSDGDGGAQDNRNGGEVTLPSPQQSNELSSTTGGDTSSAAQRVNNTLENRGLLNKALKSSLVSGHVSVLTVMMPDLTEILEVHSASEISETTRDAIIQLRECVRESNGQFVSVSSSSAVVVWNSFIRQSDHLDRACATADSIQRSIRKLNADWSNKGLPTLKLIVGVSTGVAYYGNIGSDNSKIFSVVGLPAKHSSMLSSMNVQWGTEVLVSQDVYDAMYEQYWMRPIALIDEQTMAYELGELKSQDAWVEELSPSSSIEKPDEWKLYTEAFECYQSGNYEDAHEKLSSYLRVHEHDVPAQKLHHRCLKKMRQHAQH